MVCVICFFPIFILFLKIFFWTVEIVTNLMSKEMKEELKTECKTKPRYIHKIL